MPARSPLELAPVKQSRLPRLSSGRMCQQAGGDRVSRVTDGSAGYGSLNGMWPLPGGQRCTRPVPALDTPPQQRLITK